MPTYEYQCSACGNKFEAFQSITAKPLKKCPNCGKNSARRLISAGAGVIFKGSGFYETDYRSDNYKAAAKNESSAGDAAKPPSDAKTPATAESATKTPAASSPAPVAESKPATPKKSGKNKS